MTNFKQRGMPGLYAEVFHDFCREFPRHTMRIARFLSDLEHLLKNRGIERTLCIDFPAVGKSFDRGLSLGEFVPNRKVSIYQGTGPRSEGQTLGVVPLIELCFYKSAEGRWLLRSDLDPTVVFYCRTFFYGCKKLELPAPASIVEACTLDFFKVDNWVSDIDTKNIWSDRRGRYVLDILDQVASRFIPLEYPEWKDLNPKHGPGAVSDLAFRRKDKFSFPTWPDPLQEWFPYQEFAFHKYMDRKSPGGDSLAKVCSVPKTLDKVRIITIEPAANQFIQQSLRGWLISKQTAVARICIDTFDQERSKAAAKEASIDGSSATVDLKSASDYLSTSLVRRIFKGNQVLLDMLLACRSSHVLAPDGRHVPLKKYAGQGNATTFVVQSLVYAILAVTAILADERCQKVSRKRVQKAATKVRVFGDDILLPSQNLSTFDELCMVVGLTINWDKTHNRGYFRESCGGDYYKGYDVTPFYIKDFHRRQTPEGLVSWCAVANNAYDKGLLQTAYAMRRGLNLPVNSPSGIGFSCRLPFRYSPKGSRWNGDLQRREFLEFVASARNRYRDSELRYGRLYKYFVEKPTNLVSWQGRLTTSTALRLREEWVA